MDVFPSCVLFFLLHVFFIIGRFGYHCRGTCNCVNNRSCDSVTGACPEGCSPPWSGPKCQRKDIAFDSKTAQRISDNSSSSYAVDLDPSTCSVTPRGVTGWWRADLGALQAIQTLHLLTSTGGSMGGWRILIGETERLEEMTLCKVLGNETSKVTTECRNQDHVRYVAVLNPKDRIVICQLSVYVCSAYFFGELCEQECACLEKEDDCHLHDGYCVSGCRVGRLGGRCSQECNMTYGPNCTHDCGQCTHNSSCNIESGVCDGGCNPGWTGSLCNKRCDKGNYGLDCQEVCGYCYEGDACRVSDGRCPRGCSAGWTGPLCKSGCSFGRYGVNCSGICGHCKEMSRCHSVSGVCETGCRPGWTNWSCTEACPSGTFGMDCAQYCETCEGGACNKETGHCMTECAPGWHGDKCGIKCPEDHFGPNCETACGKCQDQAPCDPSTGVCHEGCYPGYHGDACLEECKDGFYGMNCSLACGRCHLEAPCDKETGVCHNGCAANYHGKKCSQADKFVDNTQPYYKVVVAVMITVAGSVLLFVIACLVMNWRREDLSSYDVIHDETNRRVDAPDVESNTPTSRSKNDSGHMTDDSAKSDSREEDSINNIELCDS